VNHLMVLGAFLIIVCDFLPRIGLILSIFHILGIRWLVVAFQIKRFLKNNRIIMLLMLFNVTETSFLNLLQV
jgi:hypothetical protein